jgi:hypothetical protein
MCPHTTTIHTYVYIYILRSEVGLLEREHAVKVEALCVLIPLYKCPHRSEVAVLETEHVVKVDAALEVGLFVLILLLL